MNVNDEHKWEKYEISEIKSIFGIWVHFFRLEQEGDYALKLGEKVWREKATILNKETKVQKDLIYILNIDYSLTPYSLQRDKTPVSNI